MSLSFLNLKSSYFFWQAKKTPIKIRAEGSCSDTSCWKLFQELTFLIITIIFKNAGKVNVGGRSWKRPLLLLHCDDWDQEYCFYASVIELWHKLSLILYLHSGINNPRKNEINKDQTCHTNLPYARNTSTGRSRGTWPTELPLSWLRWGWWGPFRLHRTRKHIKNTGNVNTSE